jgi:hypothetical protein
MTKTRDDHLAHFDKDAEAILADLRALGDRIDDLGTLGDELTGTCDADMLACFATNTLQGSASLIREMRQLVTLPPRQLRRRRRKTR